MSLESTFQDNNYSFYDNTFQQDGQQQQNPSSCDTKRPKLLPQVPGTTIATDYQQLDHRMKSSTYASENGPPGFTFEVFGTHPDPYCTSEYVTPYGIDNDYNSEYELPARPPRARRKVLPSAPKLPPEAQYDEFESEPLSYNSQPPSKLEDRLVFLKRFIVLSHPIAGLIEYIAFFRSYYGCAGAGDLYEYDSLAGVIHHVDQLNWKNLSQRNSFDASSDYMPPPTAKRKVLPQIPVQSKYGVAKSLPATPATSAMGLNAKSRRLPVASIGIATSTTTTGFGNEYSQERSQYKSSLSEEGSAGDGNLSSMYHQFDYMSMQDPIVSTASQGNSSNRQGKPSLLADMKNLFTKTSSSILPAMSSTLNNVSSSISASLPPTHLQQSKNSPMPNDSEISYDFMKSNKFEEAAAADQNSMVEPEMSSLYYGALKGKC